MTTPAHQIAQLGADVLRQKSQAIDDVFSLTTREIIQAMQTALANSEGVGLAAPQIGISKRIIIVASRPSKRYLNAPFMPPTVMINPKFQALTNIQNKDWEGCLSVPGIRALVPRYQAITIQYTNIEGNIINQETEGFIARVFQHEFDHLEGMVYLDRVENSRDIIAESEYFKLYQ